MFRRLLPAGGGQSATLIQNELNPQRQALLGNELNPQRQALLGNNHISEHYVHYSAGACLGSTRAGATRAFAS